VASDHRLIVRREIERKRGWYLSWECNLRRCDAKGSMTVPTRNKAHELLLILDRGHQEANDDE
jgi:hypothetical protein